MVSSVRSFGLDMLLAPGELCVILPPAHCFMNVVVNDGGFVPCGLRLLEGSDGNRKQSCSLDDFGGFAISLMARNN